MTIQKKPFRSYTLDEDKPFPEDSGKIFTVRLNSKEYIKLKEDMKDFNIRNESTMLKLLAVIGRNVIHGSLGRDRIKWLFSSERVKQMPD